MADDVKLVGRLPSGESHNGLQATHGELLNDPHKMRVAVVLYDVASVHQDLNRGGRTVAVQTRRIEEIVDSGDAKILARLLHRRFEERSGQPVLPFDTEQAIDDILKGLGGDETEKAD